MAMPLGPMPASSFVTPGSEQHTWFMENAATIARSHGTEDPQEVLTLQFQAYLHTSSERYANRLATQALAAMNLYTRASLAGRHV